MILAQSVGRWTYVPIGERYKMVVAEQRPCVSIVVIDRGGAS